MTPAQSRLETIRLNIMRLAPMVEIASLLALVAVIVFALCFPASAAGATGIEKRLDVAAGGRLEIESEGASLAITTHEGAGARVVITRGTEDEEEIREDYRIDITQNGNVVRVELERLRPWRFFDFTFRSPEIAVEVPHRFDVDVVTSGGAVSVEDLDGKVDARTSGGSISLAAISGPVMATTSGGSIRLHSSGGDADLRTSGGSISIGEVDGSVNARTSGGSISIDRAAGAVVANTSGGSIEIEEVHGAIDAETAGGSVRAYLSEPPRADSSLRTSGGGITVVLADGIGLNIDARANRVTSEFDVADGDDSRRDDDELVGAINGGGPTLRLRTSGGGIRVLRR
ncbi:MAG TPA: hypothetical protein VHR17_04805 [Thermoanaerobaculia bacterium]|jgi:uncharacterized protein YuzE|nr:hypothetical protein [Thermoanaerobaculia bacterium]